MIGFLTQATAEAGAAKFSGMRTLLGEMTWALGTSNGTDKLIEYESKLNRFVRDHDARLICQYHRTRFSPELILAVIRTHPLVVYGGIVCKNPYYVPPDEFLKPNQASREVERLLNNILAWEQAQQALRQSEERLRLVIDTVPTMAWSVRPDGAVDFINQRLLNYSGLSLEEALEEPTRTIHPEDLPRVMEKWRADMAVGKPSEDEMRWQGADGEYRWFLVRTVPLRDERGNIVKWYGCSIDIEDRKQAEEALRESEERFRRLVELMPVPVYVCDASGIIQSYNHCAMELWGREPKSEDTAQRFCGSLRLYSPEGKFMPPEESPMAEVLRTGIEARNREVMMKRPDGSRITVVVNIVPLTNGFGELIGAINCFQDITERKRAEKELRCSFDQLRALAARLQSVREEERTRVAREIHDELGQALTGIKFESASLIRELPEDAKQQSNRAESIAKLADETIQAVRRISTELRPEILDELGLVAAVEWAAQEFEARAGTNCRLDLPKDDIVIDQERATALFRILQETLTNVKRHANATQVNVRLAKEGGSLTLEVHDNGKGINEEELSAGRSLGILGMRERSLLLGGEFTITGGLGEGTTVRVRIPETHPASPKGGK
jgi:PAS domain S-box-containing protein